MDPVNVLDLEEVRLHRGARGLGDALFVSTVCHEIRKRSAGTRVIVETHWPQLFYNSPSVDAVFPAGPRPGKGAIEIGYEKPWPPKRQHVLKTVCERLGIDDPDLRTYYYDATEERRRARQICPPSSRPLVVVHPFSGFFAARSKQWDLGSWQRFLDLLPPEIETSQ